MPNFIARSLKCREYPFGGEFTEFLWEAKSGDETLVLTRIGESEFFLLVKDRGLDVLIKGDKLTRPANLSLLQKALSEFMHENTLDVISSAISFNEPKSLKKTPFLLDNDEFAQAVSQKERIYVEIGFGSGRHLLYQAKNNPDIFIIGIEVYKPSIAQVSNLANIEGLKNIALINFDARLALSLIENDKIERIFLHFPVPWGKSLKRRVVSAQFAKECERTLKIGGTFELRSDDRDYSDFTISTFLDLVNSRIQVFKNRFLEVSSKYEDRWIRQDKDIYDVIFTKENQSEFTRINCEFTFDNLSLNLLNSDLAPRTFKGDDFFAHIQRIYVKNDGELLVKATFGSFYRPEHAYILIGHEKTRYLLKEPLKTAENFKAHEVLKEFLFCQKS